MSLIVGNYIYRCIAQSYGIPVSILVCVGLSAHKIYTGTNQITGTVLPDNSDSELPDSDFTVTAALGNTWSHCVNTRLFMNPSSEGDKHTISKVQYCVFIILELLKCTSYQQYSYYQ